MTAYSASVSETYYVSDIVTPPAITGPRGIVEPGSTSDHLTRTTLSRRSASETNTGSQTTTRTASHPRVFVEVYDASNTGIGIGLSPSLSLTPGLTLTPRSGTNITRTYHANRLTLVEFVGASTDDPDPSLYPDPLLFPGAIMDTVVVQHVAPRTMAETLPSIHDTVTRSSQFTGSGRHLTETLSPSSVVHQVYSAHRSISQSGNTTDSSTHIGIFNRLVSETQSVTDSMIRSQGRIRIVIESHSVSDSLSRSAGFLPNFVFETLQISDEITRRHAAVRRVDIEMLGPSVDSPFIFGGHARQITERLIAAYDVPHLTFQNPVMGQLWFNTSTNQVIAELPDWGFVLIENPITGNALYYQPIAPWTYSPMRTK